MDEHWLATAPAGTEVLITWDDRTYLATIIEGWRVANSVAGNYYGYVRTYSDEHESENWAITDAGADPWGHTVIMQPLNRTDKKPPVSKPAGDRVTALEKELYHVRQQLDHVISCLELTRLKCLGRAQHYQISQAIDSGLEKVRLPEPEPDKEDSPRQIIRE
jgi:hypothetical protein